MDGTTNMAKPKRSISSKLRGEWGLNNVGPRCNTVLKDFRGNYCLLGPTVKGAAGFGLGLSGLITRKETEPNLITEKKR